MANFYIVPGEIVPDERRVELEAAGDRIVVSAMPPLASDGMMMVVDEPVLQADGSWLQAWREVPKPAADGNGG